MTQKPNRLIDQTSPYLLQHAHNPVDWQPWSEQALTQARVENKPILLSIGYSACHWCHVMEHESFEDQGTAEQMNRDFICIKVDREERPDLDKIYQSAHQLLTQKPGGWPLTVFLDPAEHVPFFAGTYFPNQPRYGMSSFRQIMQKVIAHFHDNQEKLSEHNLAVKNALKHQADNSPVTTLGPLTLDRADNTFAEQYDSVYGGFGGAPKFPHPTSLNYCLNRQQTEGLSRSQTMAIETLQHMAAGGLYDQLGGGFYRYSVDERWEIPHFEKMLYDNAQLLPLYVDGWRISSRPDFKAIVCETADWVLREMQDEQGGYYSTLDADSEGEEGRFYVFSKQDLTDAGLDDREQAITEYRYGFDQDANFEGKWHLTIKASLEDCQTRLKMTPQQAAKTLNSADQKLFNYREQRVRPGRDEKILTSWNGLMIAGLAHAGHHLQREDYLDSARRAVDFVRATLWRDGRLLATTRDGHSHLDGYLDDYVFMMLGLLELLQARWQRTDLEFVIELAEVVLSHFSDSAGGFFFTADDHEALMHRSKPAGDDATPSGNGVAACVFQRLGHLLGEARYLATADDLLAGLSGSIARFPTAHGSLLVALGESLYPSPTVVVRYHSGDLEDWKQAVHTHAELHTQAYFIAETEQNLPGVLSHQQKPGVTTATVCRGHQCAEPVTEPQQLGKVLAELEA